MCGDYGGYKALFAQGVNEAGCLAHARRKFHELWDSDGVRIPSTACVLK